MFTSTGSFVVHPPLGKFLIGAGMALFGADSSFGWRIATALFGTATVLVLYFVAKAMTGSVAFATVASLLMAIDGLAIVAEPSRPARQLPDLLRPARVLVRPARSPHAPWTDWPLSSPRAAASGQAPSWGPVLWNRPWVIAAGAAARRRDRGQVVGPVRASPGSGSTSSSPMRSPGGAPACGSGRRMPPSARAPPRSCSSCPSPSSSTSASWIGWLVTDGGYERQAADRGPGDRLLVVGAARTAEPVAVPPRDLQLPRRTQLRARLREPRVAVAAAAAADLDVLPVDAAGRGGVRGRQRLRREHLQHARTR